MTIGIIGAGISGLTLAYELQKRGQPYRLWEATNAPGGYIQSVRDGRYLRELGPNSLLGDDALLAWLHELGLTNDLVFSKPVSKARYVFRNGQYRKLPAGPPSLLLGDFFSWKTKLAIARELSNKTRSPDVPGQPGETLAQFFRRRFSDEIVEYALGPFVAGIYAGDPERLLVSETFPSLLQYEKEFGSVLKGLIKNQRTTGRRQSFSFRNGMQTLPIALAQKLTNITFKDPVQSVDPTQHGWLVVSKSGSTTVDRLVFCVDTAVTTQLLEGCYPDLAAALRRIEYPPMTAVHSVYKRADVAHPLDGFGGLNPKVENRFSAGHIWSSSTFDFRCPVDEVLFTTFVGGRQSVANAQLDDEVIFDQVHQELSASFGIASEPVRRELYRWERAIPQYDEALLAARQLVPALEKDNLLVCANWYEGVSLSDCIKKAKALAARLL
ncbi:MAG: protoporphyrinogen oxidase [Bacteroidetes bacterium]|nr:protoporphyrinogen oxidase [Fibrella sp.]